MERWRTEHAICEAGGQELNLERPIFARDVFSSEHRETTNYERKGRRGETMKMICSETIDSEQQGDVVVWM
jgi:hypothetical protein